MRPGFNPWLCFRLRTFRVTPSRSTLLAGMHEALITDLAKLGGFKRVIARSSVMRYQNTDKPLPQVARELGVDAVITGSVFREGDRVRITAQLINAVTEEHLWADRYERELRDVLSLQNEIVGAITREINLQLTPQEEARLASARTVNPEAYEAYLRGRVHWFRLTPRDLDTALKYFELALEKDPNYALAHVGMAQVWAGRAAVGTEPPREVWPKAKMAALKALEVDDTLSEAHDFLAWVLTWYEYDWPAAERQFRRAIELNPNYAFGRLFYGLFLNSMRRWDEARAQTERALELDPYNSFFQWISGFELLCQRRYDEAITQIRKSLPDVPTAHWGLWTAFQAKRMYEEALAEAKGFLSLAAPGVPEAAEALDRGYAEAGYPGAMRRAAETLAERSHVIYLKPLFIAELYACAGEKDQAVRWLEKAYEERIVEMVYLNVHPAWDILRDDPRFQDLRRRMNLEP